MGVLKVVTPTGERKYHRLSCVQSSDNASVYLVHRNGVIYVAKIVDVSGDDSAIRLQALGTEFAMLLDTVGLDSVIQLVDAALVESIGGNPRPLRVALVCPR